MIFVRTFFGTALAAAFLAGSASTGLASSGKQAPNTGGVHDTIVRILQSPQRLPFHLQRVRKALTKHYVEGGAKPYWFGTGRMSPFIKRMQRAHEDGLKPKDYPAGYLRSLRDTVNPGDPVASAFAELSFASFYISYATDLKTGRFVPQKIDPGLFQPKRRLDQAKLLADLQSKPDPARHLNTLQPRNKHYRALRPLLARYRQIVKNGGWGKIPGGKVLKPGMSDPRVPAIRKRLKASGDLSANAPDAGETYDPALAAAVKAYQRRHGLNDEGIVGKLSLIQLNVPARERMRQIVVNMERWRWMPERMGATHIMVNIPAFQLYRVEKNRQVETVNVMVGKAYHQTPVFSDKMEYVEMNPTWTVPYSIATKEMLPKLQNDPGYLKADFEVLQGGSPVSPYSIDWTQYTRKNFPYTFRQKPGPTNALGVVKFILPNKHAVYLHDTPSRHLFVKTSRAFSHGCIRVHRPVRFAEKILARVPGWSRSRIDATLQSKKRTRVNLPKHIPVHIVYATVWAGKNGEVHFRPDIYRRDLKLYRALFAKPTS